MLTEALEARQLLAAGDAVQLVDDADTDFSTTGTFNPNSGGFASGIKQSHFNWVASTASWTFDVSPGTYHVAASWPGKSNSAADAPFSVLDGVGGSVLGTVSMNQTAEPDDFVDANVGWESLGSFTVTGSSIEVQLSNAVTAGYAIADVVRIQRVAPVSLSESQLGAVADKGHVGFGITGVGQLVDKTFTLTNDSAAAITLEPIAAPQGFSIVNNFTAGQTLAAAASVNFTVRLDATAASKSYGPLSIVVDDGAESLLELTVSGTTLAAGSAVQVVDDSDVGFYHSGTFYSISGGGLNGAMQHSHPSWRGSLARWVVDVEPGTYEVAATWPSSSARAIDAPFTIYDGVGGSVLATSTVDQTDAPRGFVEAGTAWDSLGEVTATGNTLVIEVSNDSTTGYSIADAIRVQRLADVSVSEATLGNVALGDHVGFGVTEVGSPVEKTFTLSNDSADPVLLAPITAATGFTVVNNFQSSQVLSAGQTIDFTVRLDAGADAKSYGQLSMVIEDDAAALFDFTISGTVTSSAVQEVGRFDDGFVSAGKFQMVAVGHFGSAMKTHVSYEGSRVYWVVDVQPGEYEVAVSWPGFSGNAPDAPFTVYDGVGGVALETIAVDQTGDANDFVDGLTGWKVLGDYTITGNTLMIDVTNAIASGFAVADAVRVQRLADVTVTDAFGVPIGNGKHFGFGAVEEGRIVSKTFTLSNDGGDSIELSPVSVPAGFTVVNNFTAGQVLSAGSSVDFTVQFDGTTETKAYGELSIEIDAGGPSLFWNTISGTSLAAPGTLQYLDNDETGFLKAGFFTTGAGAYGTDQNHALASWQGSRAIWVFDVQPGTYRVAATWLPASIYAPNTPFTVYDGVEGEPLGTTTFDQTVAPDDLSDAGVDWELILGEFDITGNTLMVNLTNVVANGYAAADAIRIERIEDPPGDRLDQAKVVSLQPNVPAEVTATIGNGLFGEADVDLFAVDLTAGQILKADVDAFYLDDGTWGSLLDSYLKIFDASGTELAAADVGSAAGDTTNDLDAYLSVTAPVTGTYYVGVTGAGNTAYDPNQQGTGTTASTGDYTLQLLATDTATTPSLSGLADLTIDENSGGHNVTFTIGDPDTPLDDLTTRYISSNPALIDVPSGLFSGTTASRTVSIAPIDDQLGTATVTVIVSDGTESISDSFVVTVDPVNPESEIAAVQLAHDSGTPDDLSSAIPIVDGHVLRRASETGLQVEWDHDDDEIAEATIDVDPVTFQFQYDPRVTEPTFAATTGPVGLHYRLALPRAGMTTLYGDWQPFDFSIEVAPPSPLSADNVEIDVFQTSATDHGLTYRGEITGDENLGQSTASSIVVEVDTDGDFQSDDSVAVANLADGFTYTPATPNFASHTISFRVVHQDSYYESQRAGSWNSLVFDPEEVPTITDVSLREDTGFSSTDGVTADPVIVGSVLGPVHSTSVTVGMDVDGDDVIDLTTTVDSAGAFEFAPYSFATGTVDVRLRAVDGPATGAWTDFSFDYQPHDPPALSSFGLLVDDGVADDDAITSVAMVTGTFTTSFGDPQEVEIDLGNDGSIDATAAATDGLFFFEIPSPAAGTQTIGYRPARWNPYLAQTEYGNWETFSFEYAPVTTQLVGFESLGLRNDTGADDTDLVTTDPTIVGRVDVEEYTTVKIDLDPNNPDVAIIQTGANGEFTFTPTGLAAGLQTVLFSVSTYDHLTQSVVDSAWVPFTFTLEDAVNEAPAIDSLQLLSDSGTGGDGFTENPTVFGYVTNDGSVDGLAVEIDLDDDDVGDQVVFTDSAGRFQFEPQQVRFGLVEISASVIEFDAKTAADLRSPWVDFSFTYEDQVDEPPKLSSLGFDVGEVLYGIDPKLVGVATDQHHVAGITVEVDSTGNGVIDHTTTTDSAGQFEVLLPGLTDNTTTIDVRASAMHPESKQVIVSSWHTVTVNYEVSSPSDLSAAAIVDFRLVHDTGDDDTDLLTSDPRLTGSVGRSPKVQSMFVDFEIGGVAIGSTVVGADLSWTFTPAGLSDGPVTVNARTKEWLIDGQSVWGVWTPLTFTLESAVDATAPAAQNSHQTSIQTADALWQTSRNNADTTYVGAIDIANNDQQTANQIADAQFQQDLRSAEASFSSGWNTAATNFQTAIANYSGDTTSFDFDAIVWPDAPTIHSLTIPDDADQPAPPRQRPDYVGPDYDLQSDSVYRIDMATAQAKFDYQFESAQQGRESDDADAQARFDQAVADADADRDEKRLASDDAYIASIADSFDASAALAAYNTAVQQATDNFNVNNDTSQYSSAISAAEQQRDVRLADAAAVRQAAIDVEDLKLFNAYFEDPPTYTQADYDLAVAAIEATYADEVESAWYDYDMVVADAHRSIAQVGATASRIRDRALAVALRNYQETVARAEKDQSLRLVSADIVRRIETAAIDRDHAKKVADAQRDLDHQLAANAKAEEIALDQARTDFWIAGAQAKEAALGRLHTAVGTAWSEYRHELATHEVSYFQALATASNGHTQTVADAEKVRAETVADEVRQHAHVVADQDFARDLGYADELEAAVTGALGFHLSNDLTVAEKTEQLQRDFADFYYVHRQANKEDQYAYDVSIAGGDAHSYRLQIDFAENSRVKTNAYRDRYAQYHEEIDTLSASFGADLQAGTRSYHQSIAQLDRDHAVFVSEEDHDLDRAIAAARTIYAQQVAPAEKVYSDARVLHAGQRTIDEANALKDYRIDEATSYSTVIHQWDAAVHSRWSALHAEWGTIEIDWATAVGTAEVDRAGDQHAADLLRQQTLSTAQRDHYLQLVAADQVRIDEIADKKDLYAAGVADAKYTYAVDHAEVAESVWLAGEAAWNDAVIEQRKFIEDYYFQLGSHETSFYIAVLAAADANADLQPLLPPYDQGIAGLVQQLVRHTEARQWVTGMLSETYQSDYSPVDRALANAVWTAQTTLAGDIAAADKAHLATSTSLDTALELATVAADHAQALSTTQASVDHRRAALIAESDRREEEVAARGNYEVGLFNDFATAKSNIAIVTSSTYAVADAAVAAATAVHADSIRLAENAYQEALSTELLLQTDAAGTADVALVTDTHLAQWTFVNTFSSDSQTYSRTIGDASIDLALAGAIAEADFDKQQTHVLADYHDAADTSLSNVRNDSNAILNDYAADVANLSKIHYLNAADLNTNPLTVNGLLASRTYPYDFSLVIGPPEHDWLLGLPSLIGPGNHADIEARTDDANTDLVSALVDHRTTDAADLLARSGGLGDAQIALADARGAAGVAYVTTINGAETILSAAELAKIETRETAIADARQDHAEAIAAADRAQIIGSDDALVALRNLEKNAAVVRDQAVATAEANYHKVVSAAEAQRALAIASSGNPFDVYQAAYTQAKADWIDDVSVAFVSHAADTAAAEFQVLYDLAVARGDENETKAIADETFAQDLAGFARNRVVDEVTTAGAHSALALPHLNTRRLDAAENVKAYERAIAVAEKQRATDLAAARGQQAIDLANQVDSVTANSTYSAAQADAELVYQTALADAALGWHDDETLDKQTYASQLATISHDQAVAIAGLDHTYATDVATSDQTRGNTHAVAEGAFLVAATSAENARRSSLAATDIALWNVQETARITAHTAIDTDLQSDWSQYLVDAATSRSSWWTTASAHYTNQATDRNSADSVYAGRMQTAHVTRRQTDIAAVKTHTVAAADADLDAATTRAGSARDHHTALEVPAVTYFVGIAGAVRDRDVAIAQADRDFASHADATLHQADLDAAEAQYVLDRSPIDSAWLAAESTEHADRYADFASANFDRSLDLIAADVQHETSRTGSEAAYADEESDAYLQATTAWASVDAAYRQYEANSFSAAATALSGTNGSPWAGFDADYYSALATRVATVSGAHQTQMVAKAGAQKNVEIAHTGAETTWHLANINGSGTRASALPTADAALATQLSADYAAESGTGNTPPELSSPLSLSDQYTITDHPSDHQSVLYWTDLVTIQQPLGGAFGVDLIDSTLLFEAPTPASYFPITNVTATKPRFIIDDPEFWNGDADEREGQLYDFSLEYRYDWFFDTNLVAESTPADTITAEYEDSSGQGGTPDPNTFGAAAFDTRAAGSGQANTISDDSTEVTDGTEYRQDEINQILAAGHPGEATSCNLRECLTVRSTISDRPEFSLSVYADVYTPQPAEIATLDHLSEGERENNLRLADLLKEQHEKLNPSSHRAQRNSVGDGTSSFVAAGEHAENDSSRRGKSNLIDQVKDPYKVTPEELKELTERLNVAADRIGAGLTASTQFTTADLPDFYSGVGKGFVDSTWGALKDLKDLVAGIMSWYGERYFVNSIRVGDWALDWVTPDSWYTPRGQYLSAELNRLAKEDRRRVEVIQHVTNTVGSIAGDLIADDVAGILLGDQEAFRRSSHRRLKLVTITAELLADLAEHVGEEGNVELRGEILGHAAGIVFVESALLIATGGSGNAASILAKIKTATGSFKTVTASKLRPAFKKFFDGISQLRKTPDETAKAVQAVAPRTGPTHVTGELVGWEARQANIYGEIFGGGHLNAPKALEGIEGIFTATNGRRFQPSFKEWTHSSPANFVKATRRKIADAIRKLDKGIASGSVDTSIPSHLLFSLKADHSSKILKMLRHSGGANDIATYKRLFASKFDRVFFEASDGVFELDLVLGTISKVVN